MQLIPITRENVAAYVAFRTQIADDELRRYYDSVDLAAVLLKQGNDLVLCDENGDMQAAVSIIRTACRDGNNRVTLSVEGCQNHPETAVGLLKHVLHAEGRRASERDTHYRIYNPPFSPFPNHPMTEMGFTEIPAKFRYSSENVPALIGEFPYADRAAQRGYTTRLIDDQIVANDPDIFARLADIQNRAFANLESVSPVTAEHIRKDYDAKPNGIIIARLGDEITGSLTLTHLGDCVLIPQISCLRRHWGTGVVDLMCRHLGQLVADRWYVPIIAYVDAQNAASWKALERFGMDRVAQYTHWERFIPRGEQLNF